MPARRCRAFATAGATEAPSNSNVYSATAAPHRTRNISRPAAWPRSRSRRLIARVAVEQLRRAAALPAAALPAAAHASRGWRSRGNCKLTFSAARLRGAATTRCMVRRRCCMYRTDDCPTDAKGFVALHWCLPDWWERHARGWFGARRAAPAPRQSRSAETAVPRRRSSIARPRAGRFRTFASSLHHGLLRLSSARCIQASALRPPGISLWAMRIGSWRTILAACNVCVASAAASHGTQCGAESVLDGVCFQRPAAFAHDASVPNATACACACDASPQCSLWVYRPLTTELNPGCFLKPGGGQVQNRTDALCTSGSRSPHHPPAPIQPPPPGPPEPLPPRNPDRRPPAYWCTWQAQSREWMQGAADFDFGGGEAFWRAWRNHDPPPDNPTAGYSGWEKYLNQSYLFRNPGGVAALGEQGWAYLFSKAVRSGLYFSLDNQWASKSGHLDTESRFPEFANKSPSPLAALVAKIKALGWAGLSLWVPGGASVAQLKEYHGAGVGVLKVDGGDRGCEITRLARIHAPNLWVEHGFCGPDCPLNGPLNGSGAGRWPMSMAAIAVATLNCTDSLRSYDMVKSLSIVEVIDRQSKLYSLGASLPRSTPDSETPTRYIGGSGEHMVTAGLGGVIQPMDSNTRGLKINPAYSVYVNGPKGRHRQNREDEISRWCD
eukprot:SAG31_NODE_2584_length_5434_cov_3.784067_1_plen_666_part_00